MSTLEAAPFRLLFAAEDLDPARGGQERSILDLARGLRRHGCEVRLLHGGRSDPGDLPAERFPVAGATRGARLHRLLAALERRIAGGPADERSVAFLPLRGADAYFPRGGLYREAFRRSAEAHPQAAGRVLARVLGRLDGRRRLLVRREAAILADAAGSRLLAVSDLVARDFLRHAEGAGARVRVVRNGVASPAPADAAARARAREVLGLDAATWVLLALAHNPRLKGIPELLAAFAALDPAGPPALLLVAGRGALPAGAPPRVRWLGPVEDPGPLLAAADALAHPTHYDPASRVVLEALAAGVPVLTTQRNGAAEDVGEAGIVIADPRDAGALREGLERLRNPATRALLAAAARRIGPGLGIERSVLALLLALAAPGPQAA
jgi:UDP-glucose:(heptosyl)LPS alpha-1,3-glucosyltransferase